MSVGRRLLGKKGEAYVVDYLKAQGFTICFQNYITRRGEVDIIAKKEHLLAFIEVKTRHISYFPLSELVPRSKQKKIKTAYEYICVHKMHSMIYRFDAALLEISQSGEYTISYLAHAFTAPSSALLH